MNDSTQGVSANWLGYTLQDTSGAGLQFTSVTGTWRVPVTTCESGTTSSAAFWVGLGGSSDTATGLEQTGTGADCTNGTPRYYAWYEILPASSVEVPLTVKPGDQITTSVNVNGTTVLVQIKNRTRKTSFTKALTVAAPDISSAEWIAEAPSACNSYGRCQVLPLANFGNVTFTRAAAIATRRFLARERRGVATLARRCDGLAPEVVLCRNPSGFRHRGVAHQHVGSRGDE